MCSMPAKNDYISCNSTSISLSLPWISYLYIYNPLVHPLLNNKTKQSSSDLGRDWMTQLLGYSSGLRANRGLPLVRQVILPTSMVGPKLSGQFPLRCWPFLPRLPPRLEKSSSSSFFHLLHPLPPPSILIPYLPPSFSSLLFSIDSIRVITFSLLSIYSVLIIL